MDPIQELRLEKQRISQRLTEIDTVLQQYDELQDKMKRLLEGGPQDVVRAQVHTRTDSRENNSEPVARSREPEVLEFERVVREVLSEAEGPLDRSEVYKRVSARGHIVYGNPPENVVSTRLSRMGDVSGKRGLGFWLTSRESELFPVSSKDKDTDLDDLL